MSKISFQEVCLRFPGADTLAVKQVNAQIESGQLVVILGTSGSGKTTLLKMVNRLYEPTSGQICIGERDIRNLPATELRRYIGYVIQQVGLFPHFTVAENIAVVPKLLGWPRSKFQERTDELLNLVKLPGQEYRHRYPSQLSGGQQQRVGIARALAGDPQLILMDEPFGALDAITREELQQEILRIHRELGKTILFVSHDVDEALLLADKIMVMDQGELLQFATPLEILTEPANDFVANLMGAKDILRQLSLLRVNQVMQPESSFRQDGVQVSIDVKEDLRQALMKLLATGVEELRVEKETEVVGFLSLKGIQSCASGLQE